MAKEKQIGKIAHYFNHIGVAVVALSAGLKVGESIHIVGHSADFTQKVESMQIEHEKVEKAKKGESVGLKVEQPTKEGAIVYKAAE
ncbi:MAG: hypothetical protein NT135_02875 [Candidatus Berkelbacteria bacterium]|nr:hypothetical protein [Candidatus Berkelbacteria bacterium]